MLLDPISKFLHWILLEVTKLSDMHDVAHLLVNPLARG